MLPSAVVKYHLTLRQLQEESISPLIIISCAAGLIAVFLSHLFPQTWQGALLGLTLMLTPLLTWALREHSYLAGIWLLFASWLGCALAMALWLPGTAATGLLALPVALAALFIDVRAGFLAGLGASLLLPAMAYAFPNNATARNWGVAWAIIWGIFLLAWLSSRPTQTAIHWSWESYDQARKQLELARERQVELSQITQDLARDNEQMARLNQLLGAARRAAEVAERSKAEFAANVSHELRTPLNMIIGFSEMILQAPHTYSSNLPPALLADLEVIHRNSQHLSSLIDDVLDLSRIEAGQMALARERVTISEIIEAALVAVQPLFKSKGLYLQAEVDGDLPPVFCDRTRIREVVLNLLSNAGRFTEQGGVHIHAWRDRNEILISVADTGPGIAPADKDRIFQPFEQLDSSIRRRYGGSGLGLAISKSFVELHGGRMWLTSQVGQGTTFFLSLPIDPPAASEADVARWLSADWEYQQRTHRSAPPTSPPQPRLVVVERDQALARLLSRYLDGKDIVPVNSLQEAVQEMSRAPAQALLINEPSVSRALEDMQEASFVAQETPVIICSVPGMRQAAEALGAADYLIKPLSQDKLLAALDRLALPGNTLLVVDDEPEASRLYLRMFASAGRRYHVLRATNGQQALRLLQEQHPDAVLLDLVMPEMDGFRLLEAKSQDPDLCNIPVIVISARDPAGQPIVSRSLAVTRAGGISASQLLECIAGLTTVLSPGAAERKS